MRASLLTVCVVIAGLLAAPAWATPPTLTGEFLVGTLTTQITSASCNPTGESSFMYTTSGAAVGPYAGTYFESGTVKLAPFNLPIYTFGLEFGPVTTIDAFFMIDSPFGQVSGTKQLVLTSGPFGFCYDLTAYTVPGGPTISGTAREVCACPTTGVLALSYDATITTATEGSFRDQGSSGLLLAAFDTTVDGTGAPYLTDNYFNEGFASSLLSPIPISTTGHATGGGQIPSDITFGFVAKSDTNGIKGECTVVDRARNVKIKCLDATAFVQSATHATVKGDALVNGAPTSYQIDVDDLAEPGAGQDTFSIRTGSGYTAGGTLTQGNVQLHA